MDLSVYKVQAGDVLIGEPDEPRDRNTEWVSVMSTGEGGCIPWMHALVNRLDPAYVGTRP